MATPSTLPPLPAGAPLAPASEAELVEVVKEAAARGQPLFCEGNGSKRHHGPTPPERARRLSLRRLAGLTAYDPADLVVSAWAGTRFADLQRALAAHGQWLPLDPPYPNATVGGILAAASAGPRRFGYGTVKDLLLGLRVVAPSGEVTKSGGRVVKNVSGFDLHRLQVGAFGTLGLLLEAHFRVSTRPAVSAALVFGGADFEDVQRKLLAVAASAVRPVALEALDGGATASLRAVAPPLAAVLPDGNVGLIGLEGSPAAVARMCDDLRPLRSAGPSTLLEAEATAGLWRAFRDEPAQVLETITLRVGARPHDQPELLRSLGLEGLSVVARTSHVGSGICRLRVERGDPRALASIVAAAHTRARQQGGYVLVESAPLGMAGRETLPFGASTDGGLGARLKQAWDPNGLFNPGRVAL